jgi:hypothetical protein
MNDQVKVAVLGNSHLAAAKAGWEQISDRHPSRSLTFFGAPRDMMRELELAGDVLRPDSDRLRNKLRRSSDGLEAVLLPSYDAFILYGLEFGPRRLLQLYRTHRPMGFEWREPLPDLPPLERRPDRVQMIPERLFDQAVISGLRESMAWGLAEHIVKTTGAPVCLVAAPGFNEAVLDEGEWDGILGSNDIAILTRRYHRLAKEACPEGATLLLPRSELTVHGLFTARGYATDASGSPKQDLVHTSAAYGAAMMSHSLAILADAPGVRAA